MDSMSEVLINSISEALRASGKTTGELYELLGDVMQVSPKSELLRVLLKRHAGVTATNISTAKALNELASTWSGEGSYLITLIRILRASFKINDSDGELVVMGLREAKLIAERFIERYPAPKEA